MTKTTQALQKRFKDHRIIFWYDEKEEFTEEYETLALSDVEKVEVDGNAFEVKYRIQKQSPTSKFLLYFKEPKPAPEQNWLLDIELAHHVFHTDQEALFLQELGLGYHLKELVAEHIEFFKSKERRAKLKEMLSGGEEHKELRQKILAVLFGVSYGNLVTCIHAHSTAFIAGKDQFDKDLERFNLKDFYWSAIQRKYNYQSEALTIYDFLMAVFNSNFVLGTATGLSKESRLLLSLWKDTVQYRESFGKVSEKIASDIDVRGKLASANISEIVGDDLFSLVDHKVMVELIELITSEEISNDKVIKYIKQRENKYWYKEFTHLYQSIGYASELITLVRQHGTTSYDSFDEGVTSYSSTLYEVDQYYRKFIWHYRQAKQDKGLDALAKKIEKVYSNDWLLIYNNNWQKVIDKMSAWKNDEVNSQQQFFTQQVKPYIEKKQRLFVIISDALRYECGVELQKRIQSENRYESSIAPIISALPSYTQLGMASLLPHKELSIKKNSDNVIVDGMSSIGVKGRNKILATNSGVRATAIKAEEFMKMNSSKEGRSFVKDFDLIYIYHNRIDKTGDDKTSENKVFEAVEDELQFLLDLLKKAANMNGNNMIVTSDHGFLYQYEVLDDSDFSTANHTGKIWKENRRYVIGQELKNDAATKAFKGIDLKLCSEVDVLIPKSINRIRVSGAGSRFIHGGSTLQEIVIPLIKITKKRTDTTTQVEVDIIMSTNKISNNITAISFIQSDLATARVLPRKIRSAFYAEDGTILSDQFKYLFDIDEGSERQREVKHRFQFSAQASEQFRNQGIKLILEEPIEGAKTWKLYKEYDYVMNISSGKDFDF